MKINEITPDTDNYLQIISEIADKPKRLYYTGTIPTQRVPTIAVVGTRKPTAYGREVTTALVSDLARKGIVIVSGLALGVDALAHQAALDTSGTTIAIIPSVLPHIQPSTNRDLAERIISRGGAIICEHTADERYVVGKWSFLERNRLVAGIADAILITEASARSGTLNTAMHALSQGKEVFVVPGNITSPQSAGCNALLRQGATPVTCAEDILAVIAPNHSTTQSKLPLGDTPIESAILQALSDGLRDADEIQRTTGIDAAEFTTALTMLEINGTIRPLGANKWTIR